MSKFTDTENLTDGDKKRSTWKGKVKAAFAALAERSMERILLAQYEQKKEMDQIGTGRKFSRR